MIARRNNTTPINKSETVNKPFFFSSFAGIPQSLPHYKKDRTQTETHQKVFLSQNWIPASSFSSSHTLYLKQFDTKSIPDKNEGNWVRAAN